uniref:C2H2-type domain-containing protein n=1 Tax=Bursaphelenchus xylophilus TaxID=6326 RepID=A0A1I7S5D8_BURXY
MNSLLTCHYENCGSRFQTHFDQIAHFETNHYADAQSKILAELNALQSELDLCKDDEEKAQVNERFNAFYSQAIQMSLLKKLRPFEDNYIPRRELEKKPLTLNFCNYKKRPPSAAPTPSGSQKRQSVPSKRLGEPGSEPAKAEGASDERKYRCTMEGCNRAYKNTNGLRNHIKTTHGVTTLQVNIPTGSPRPASSEIIQGSAPVAAQKFVQPVETPTVKQDDVKAQPQFRGGSRMTPNEEIILSRVQMSTMNDGQAPMEPLPPTPKKSEKKVEKNYACDSCPKTYKTAANLRKHMADQHGKAPQSPAIDHRQPQRVNYTLGQPVQNAMPGTMANAQQNMTLHSPRSQPVQQRLPQSPLTQGHHSPRNVSVQQVMHSPVNQQTPPQQRTYAAVTPRQYEQQQFVQPIHYSNSSPSQPSTPTTPTQYEQQSPQESYNQGGSVTVVMPDDQRNASRAYGPQYERYPPQPIAQRRLSGPKVQQTHPYYNQKTARPGYQQPSGHQMEYVRTTPVQSGGPIRGSQMSTNMATPQTNFTQQPHYGQRAMTNNYEARTIRRAPQPTSSNNLSAQLAPLNVGQSGGSTPSGNVETIQITKVPSSQCKWKKKIFFEFA